MENNDRLDDIADFIINRFVKALFFRYFIDQLYKLPDIFITGRWKLAFYFP